MSLAAVPHRLYVMAGPGAGCRVRGVPGWHGARVDQEDAHLTGLDECIYGVVLTGQARAGAGLEQWPDSARTVPEQCTEQYHNGHNGPTNHPTNQPPDTRQP